MIYFNFRRQLYILILDPPLGLESVDSVDYFLGNFIRPLDLESVESVLVNFKILSHDRINI